MEPPVIQNVPFHSDGRGPARYVGQDLAVLVHVYGLPHVERYRLP